MTDRSDSARPPIDERLPAAALRAYELAKQHCDVCAHSHGVWPVLRAARITYGLDRDRPGLLEVLRPLMPAVRDVLVAGAADTGLMALMRQAATPDTRITVIDRCRTPLTLVEELAARLALPVETQLATLQDFDRPGAYDLVFGHSVFGHIRHPDQPPAMRNLFRCLRPGGHLLLVFRDKMAGDADVTNDARSVTGWWDWIKAKVEEWEAAGNRLPDDREGFMALLRRYAGTRADRHPGGRPADQFRSLVEDAGFEIERLAPLPRSKVWEAGGGVAEAGRPGFALLARRPPAD